MLSGQVVNLTRVGIPRGQTHQRSRCATIARASTSSRARSIPESFTPWSREAAPEVVNARLAMLGFAIAMIGEIRTGETVSALAQDHPVAILTLGFLVVAGSLVPIRAGALVTESFKMFTPRAEMVNGRLAMLGFLGLVALERVAQQPFF